MHHYVDATTDTRNPDATTDDRNPDVTSDNGNLNIVTGRLATYVGEQGLFVVVGLQLGTWL